MTTSNATPSHVLITGGSGFIGSNLAQRLLAEGQRVILLDNLSRPGVERNFAWLSREYGRAVELVKGDCRDKPLLERVVRGASQVFHFAAQVAVTSSLDDPTFDFEVNARGTLNVLEALRALPEPPPLIYTSTNKVYGSLSDVELQARGRRWEPLDHELASRGIDERRPLDFHSPYGCSKGSADQYVLDYARSFGVPALVFRMSCIYGPRQFGTEDQGWVAHFMIRLLAGEALTIYGDGKQVRDALYVDDLLDALLAARDRAHELRGRAFNVGGGSANSTSLLELIERLEVLTARRATINWQPPRVGDQRWYVSDAGELGRRLGWRPRTSLGEGVSRLHAWLCQERQAGPRREPAELRPLDTGAL